MTFDAFLFFLGQESNSDHMPLLIWYALFVSFGLILLEFAVKEYFKLSKRVPKE